jgi:hypothetical protein
MAGAANAIISAATMVRIRVRVLFVTAVMTAPPSRSWRR